MRLPILLLIGFIHQCACIKEPSNTVLNLYDDGMSNGIQSFEKTELSQTLSQTSKPWLVQFYASWCSHCQRYAPKFKKFGYMVQGWNDIIGVGVVNCAQEFNIDACRNYEIEGYPALKLFSPHKPFPKNGLWMKVQEPNALVNVLTDWIETFQHNKVSNVIKASPDLTSFTATNPIEIWKSENKRLQNANSALLLFCNDTHDYMVNRLILDHYYLTKSSDRQTIVRKVLVGEGSTLDANNTKTTSNSLKLARTIGIRNQTTLPLVVAVNRHDLTSQHSSQNCNAEVLNLGIEKGIAYKDTLNKLVAYSLNSSGVGFDSQSLLPYKCSGDDFEINSILTLPPIIEKIKDKSLIEKRRYTVFMNDLENALIYSLGHEVAEKRIIEGKALIALENYLEVLVRLFPTKGRKNTSAFLRELHTWTRSQKDRITGESFKRKISDLKEKHSAFSDVGDYIGCKGSSMKYGQYPCGVWSLWHVLTVRQTDQDINSRSPVWVLMTMVDYIKHFFGCRHCAEHFLKIAEDGKVVQKEVHSVEDSILWLWRAHNLANLRLKDDSETNDPAYPKEVFPNEAFCARCFQSASDMNGNTLTLDDKSYILSEVLDFLQHMYGSISMANLRESDESQAIVNGGDTTIIPLTTDDQEIYEELNQLNETLSTQDPTSSRQFIYLEMDIRVLYGIIIILFILFLRSIIKKKGGCLMFMINTHQAYNDKHSGVRTKKNKLSV